MNEPAAPNGIIHPACFDPTVPVPLQIGQSLQWQGLIILHASGLRAVATILRAGEPLGGPETKVRTPILRLHNLPRKQTQAAIVSSPRLQAIVRAPAGAPIYYSDRVDCFEAHPGVSYGGTTEWTAAYSRTIIPTPVNPCTRITRWRIAIAIQGMAPVWLDRRIPLPRRWLSAIDRRPDSISIDMVYPSP